MFLSDNGNPLVIMSLKTQADNDNLEKDIDELLARDISPGLFKSYSTMVTKPKSSVRFDQMAFFHTVDCGVVQLELEHRRAIAIPLRC